jgi:hypothetical protein
LFKLSLHFIKGNSFNQYLLVPGFQAAENFHIFVKKALKETQDFFVCFPFLRLCSNLQNKGTVLYMKLLEFGFSLTSKTIPSGII